MKTQHHLKVSKYCNCQILHNKSFGNNNNRLVKKIIGENPDIIVMTGDMVNAKIMILKSLLI